MATAAFRDDMNELSHIQASEDGALNYPYILSPSPTNLPQPTGLEGYTYAVDTPGLRYDTVAARTAYMEARLSYLGKSVNGYLPLSAADEDALGGFYPPTMLSSQHRNDELAALPDPTWRYESPSGSCGGDGTEAESTLSEQSRSHVNVYPQSQCTASHSPFPSPLSDAFESADLSNRILTQNIEGSYCGSEYSVSLREVQHYPDPDPETEPKFEIDIGPDGQSFTFHQSLPLRNADPRAIESVHTNSHAPEVESLTGDVDGHIESPMAKVHLDQISATIHAEPSRKRMRYSIPTPRSVPSTHNPSDDEKPPRTRTVPSRSSKRSNKSKYAQSTRGPYSSRARQKTSERQFICVFAHYGCNSTFSAKNEWKRHVSSQHLQLGYYRCDVGCCNVSNPYPSPPSRLGSISQLTPRSPNDFNRKDLFTQHQRRMHSPWAAPNASAPSKSEQDAFDKSLEKVRKRCWIERRTPPQRSVCNFCGREFSGVYCWDDRMEHVGKHYEKGDKETGEDVALREWAVREGIVRGAGKGIWVLASPKEMAEQRMEEFINAIVT
ncbi:hypothetical protein AJ79_01942 [Helicocarpus griseus UAMH5409]|uniref:C2H2-type domain-containing protein n=1 Tax=Helicocarpus griseus UAMH5409 TaxID=1447875 RepID=A0A2B7Y4R3_9EURO|nr:hypothetical protein AJ79_01942 [Helicocarpus griseus UAMH5409]